MSKLQDKFFHSVAKVFNLIITLQSSQAAHIIWNSLLFLWLAFLLTVTYWNFSSVYRMIILSNFSYYVLPVLNLIFALGLIILIILQRGDQGAFQGAVAKNHIDSATMRIQTIKLTSLLFFHLFINNQMIVAHANILIS
jgi:preprotein translocase subunit SecG